MLEQPGRIHAADDHAIMVASIASYITSSMLFLKRKKLLQRTMEYVRLSSPFLLKPLKTNDSQVLETRKDAKPPQQEVVLVAMLRYTIQDIAIFMLFITLAPYKNEEMEWSMARKSKFVGWQRTREWVPENTMITIF
mmetsp:Transcript_27804/g.42776  ORF Transcript_27804/g.42776 Transcript_27804/m.42776 type:complete len:137 (-) Transcript_27804:4269-4679(-)